MARSIRILAPSLYAAAVLVGFLVSGRVGTIITIAGAVVLGAVFTVARPGAGPEGGRNRNRNRNRS